MENIKLVIEFILVAQFVSAIAIVYLSQKFKFFLDHYNTNMKNIVDSVNQLSDNIDEVYDHVTEFIDDLEEALEEAEKELEEE